MSIPVEDHNKNILHQCPRCEKESLVQLTHSHYRCLWCNFEKDLENPTEEVFPLILTWLLGGYIVWAMLLIF